MRYFIYGCLIMAAILLGLAGVFWCVNALLDASSDYWALKAFERAMTP